MIAGELLFATNSGMARDLTAPRPDNFEHSTLVACRRQTSEVILKQVLLDDDMFIIGVLDKESK